MHCDNIRSNKECESGEYSSSINWTNFSMTSCSNRVPISFTREDSIEGASPLSISRATDNDRLRMPQYRATSSPNRSCTVCSSGVPFASRNSCSIVEKGDSHLSGPPLSYAISVVF